ncbi:MAG: hypothetical protein ABFD82_16840 [Syntrophaceae bacterium]
MSKRKTKLRRKRFAKEESAIRRIIYEWQPIGLPTPEDEYDCLVHHVISILHARGNHDDVAYKIKYELENHFGLRSISTNDINIIAGKIFDRWTELKKS